MPSANTDRSQEVTTNLQLVGTLSSTFPSPYTMTTGLEHKDINTRHIEEPILHHDVRITKHDDIVSPDKTASNLMGFDDCSISCPVSPTAMGEYEIDVCDKPHNLWSSNILATLRKERKFQDQPNDHSNSMTTDRYINPLPGQLNPPPKPALALFNQKLNVPSQLQDQCRCRKLLPQYMLSSIRAKLPNLRRTQSLDSNMKSNEPARTDFSFRKTTAFERSGNGDHHEFAVIAQACRNQIPVDGHEDKEQLEGRVQVPRILIQGTHVGEEHASESHHSSQELKSEDDATATKESVPSDLSNPLTRKEIFRGRALGAADKRLVGSQNLLIKPTIEFDLVPSTCIGTTKKGFRCKRTLSKSARIEIQRTVESLLDIELSREQKSFSGQLELLAHAGLCKTTHQKQSEVDKVMSIWNEELTHAALEVTSLQFLERILLPSRSALPPSEVDQKEKLQKSSSADISLTYGFEGGHYAIRTFVSYDSEPKGILNTESFLRGAIMRDLSPREIKSGFIYIYWFPGNFGLIKIGVTTVDVKKRLKEWKNKCGHQPLLRYPELPMQRVPHVFRVEALVHAALRTCRKREVRCQGCGRNHIEWFEKTLPDAIAAVEKWSAWMSAEPYVEQKVQEWDKKGKKMVDRSTWKLNSDYLQDIQTLCQPDPVIPTPPPLPLRQRPQIDRPSSDSVTRTSGLRSRSPRVTRSMMRNERSKTDVPDDATSFPHFSEEFFKASLTKDSSSNAPAA